MSAPCRAPPALDEDLPVCARCGHDAHQNWRCSTCHRQCYVAPGTVAAVLGVPVMALLLGLKGLVDWYRHPTDVGTAARLSTVLFPYAFWAVAVALILRAAKRRGAAAEARLAALDDAPVRVDAAPAAAPELEPADLAAAPARPGARPHCAHS